MTTAEVLRQVALNEAVSLLAVVGLIVGTILTLRYVDRWWTFIPRRKQRKAFGERW